MELSYEFFGSLIGAVVGSALAGLGFVYRKSSEHKGDLRKLIFLLMEMYGFLKTVEISTPRKYLVACESVMVKLGYEETQNKDELFEVMEPLIQPQVETALNDLGDWDGGEYINSLKSVARYNPVAAYRLRSNTLLKYIVPEMRKYWDGYLKTLDQHGVPRDEAEKNFPIFEGSMLKNVRLDLRVDILSLARSVSYLEFFRLKKALHRLETRDTETAMEPLIRDLLIGMGHLKSGLPSG